MEIIDRSFDQWILSFQWNEISLESASLQNSKMNDSEVANISEFTDTREPHVWHKTYNWSLMNLLW